jgi:dTDP-4-amino-4,6-dideoxygalactose transaminase
VRVSGRARVQQELNDAGIGTGIHYPMPLHLSKAYDDLAFKPGDFPVAEHVAAEILSLPMFPGLTRESQARVVEALVDATAERRMSADASAQRVA